MANRKDLYRILDLEEGASEDDIEKAFKRKIKECHPDLHPDDPQAAIKTRRLVDAREALLNGNVGGDATHYSEVYMVFTWRSRASQSNSDSSHYYYDPVAEIMYKEIFAFLYLSSLRDLRERLKKNK